MDDIKREELEKPCKKIHKIRARMVAVRMVWVLDMSVEGTTSLRYAVPRGSATGCAAIPRVQSSRSAH